MVYQHSRVPAPAQDIASNEAMTARNTLTGMHKSCIFVHMRTTLNIDEDLLQKARRLRGLKEKTAIVHAGLEALIALESARRLAALGGSEKGLRSVRRRRPRRAS